MTPLLSILIPTLPERYELFQQLISELREQINTAEQEYGKGCVELIYFGDNCQRTIGKKRNELRKLAQGKYIVMIDDDDMIYPDYVEQIMQAIINNKGVDCICFNVWITHNGGKGKRVCYSKDYDNETIGHTYHRRPNHLMVVKRTVSNKVKFEDVKRGEDTRYSNELVKHIKTEVRIDKVLYHYKFNINISKTLLQ